MTDWLLEYCAGFESMHFGQVEPPESVASLRSGAASHSSVGSTDIPGTELGNPFGFSRPCTQGGAALTAGGTFLLKVSSCRHELCRREPSHALSGPHRCS